MDVVQKTGTRCAEVWRSARSSSQHRGTQTCPRPIGTRMRPTDGSHLQWTSINELLVASGCWSESQCSCPSNCCYYWDADWSGCCVSGICHALCLWFTFHGCWKSWQRAIVLSCLSVVAVGTASSAGSSAPWGASSRRSEALIRHYFTLCTCFSEYFTLTVVKISL